MDRVVRRRTTIRILNKTHVVGLIALRAEDVQPNSCDRPSCAKRVRVRPEPRVESAIRGDTNRKIRRGTGPNEEITHKMGDANAERSVLLIIREVNSVAQPMNRSTSVARIVL